MNTGQIIYALALAGVFAWRGSSFGAWALLANMTATLAACLALDMGMDRQDATLTMMVIDFMSGAVLLTKHGLPRLLAVGYAITVPIYAANIAFGVSESTTFAIVMSIGFVQIAVAGIGTGGNDRGGRSRFHNVGGAVSIPRGVARAVGVGMAQGAARRAQDGREL